MSGPTCFLTVSRPTMPSLLIIPIAAAFLAAVYWLGWAAIEAAMGGAPPQQ